MQSNFEGRASFIMLLAVLGSILGMIVQCVLIVVLVRVMVAFEKIVNAMAAASDTYAGRLNSSSKSAVSDPSL